MNLMSDVLTNNVWSYARKAKWRSIWMNVNTQWSHVQTMKIVVS